MVGQHLPLTQLSQLGQQDWQLVNQVAASRKSRFMLHVYHKQSQQLSLFVETLQPPLQLLIIVAVVVAFLQRGSVVAIVCDKHAA